MRIEFYNSLANRKALLISAHAIGESIVHDDFLDQAGNETDGKSGRLTLDIQITPPLTPDQITVQDIIAKIEADQSLNNLEERNFRRLYHLGGIR